LAALPRQSVGSATDEERLRLLGYIQDRPPAAPADAGDASDADAGDAGPRP